MRIINQLAIGILLCLSVQAAVLRVPFPYGRIQWAIDASQAGDTVLVERGTYRQRLTIPVHDLTLASRCLYTDDTLDIANTVLDGEFEGTVITVLAGNRLFRLNGFVIRRGSAVFDTMSTGGGVWIQTGVNVVFENLVFTENVTDQGSFGAAVYGGFSYGRLGTATIRNVQITHNNHLNGVPQTAAFALRGTGRFEVSNVFCNGAGFRDPAFFIDTNDSLFADSIRVIGYNGNVGTVCRLGSRGYAEINHLRVQNNTSRGGNLFSYHVPGGDGGFVCMRNVLVTQNADSSSTAVSYRSFVSVSSDRFEMEDVTVIGNRLLTGYALDLSAMAYSPLRRLVVEDNVSGSAGTWLEGPKGSLANFRNVSLDSAVFQGNVSHLFPEQGLQGYATAPLVNGTYLTVDDLEPDSAVWRHVRFLDNMVMEYTDPGQKRNGIRGRAVRIIALHQGRFLFDDCQWINQRTNVIAREVDVFPGPRNVGSTVELVGDYGFEGSSIEFMNCLFMDNDDGGLYAEEAGSGLMRNCQFIRNNRMGFYFYSNNQDAFLHVHNVLISGTVMQEYFLQRPYLQGIFHVHGEGGALIENVTAVNCSTAFAISLGYDLDGPTLLRNTILWDVDYDQFIRPSNGNEQQGDFAYCLADLVLPGTGNLHIDPQFDAQLGPPWLSPASPCIDAGNPEASSNDMEDPANPGFAHWPSLGGLRNDIGFTGGPYAAVFDTNWVALPTWEPHLVPRDFSLGAPWPNPFNPATRVPFTLKRPLPVRLTVHNLLGQEVAVLLDRVLPAGTFRHQWNATGQASGIYLITLQVDLDRTETRAITLLR